MLIDTLLDEDIIPDYGSANPFTTATAAGSNTYTVTVGPGSAGASNLLSTGGSRLIYVIYRVIVPDKGLDRGGGVDVPSVTLVAQDGTERRLRACPFASAESSLGGMIPILIASGFSQAANFLQKILDAAHQRTSLTGSCNTAASQSARLRSISDRLPAPTFSRTRRRPICKRPMSVFTRTRSSSSEGRPWFFPKPTSEDRSRTPLSTARSRRDIGQCATMMGCFRILLSRAPAIFRRSSTKTNTTPMWSRPTRLRQTRPGSRGDPTNLPITLILRSISFDPKYETIPSDYYPQGVICDKTVLTAQGWQGCFAAAGVKVATGP